MDRLVWTPAQVVDVDGPRAMLRAYLEQKAVRELLASVCRPDSHANAAACDVGCGFGRLTPVLTEFAAQVAGFEREPDLLATARRLQPTIDFRAIDTLTELPAAAASLRHRPRLYRAAARAGAGGPRRHRRDPPDPETDRRAAPLRGNRPRARSRRPNPGRSRVHLRAPGRHLRRLAGAMAAGRHAPSRHRTRLPAARRGDATCSSEKKKEGRGQKNDRLQHFGTVGFFLLFLLLSSFVSTFHRRRPARSL